MDNAEICQVLKKSEFLKGLAEEEIIKVSKICRVADYEAGTYIFHQGEFCQNLFIIVEGYVFLERTMDMDKRKGYVVIDALGSGRSLGCWSTLLSQTHVLMSSANCQKATKMLVLNGNQLRDMMMKQSDFGFNILERLCFLLRDRIKAAYGALDKI
jgi:CRP-like cAMP-binding protein